ncbi:copper amine oxidase [Paenibacillus glucanolyticus]|uniref:copper amine oxidase N-terminal domain-containing protein n=1 Tax=Paenibacillus glucanolyticus TaxID=59843 RepID=UPI000D1B5D22|nr:copper amine oxidase N-terminal domain-containing protein [Paenibacillus glucanolyticus]AVV58553.1 copper amine oxidase [Paenibacillus glucanolyticus]MCA4751069.1 copper amine oxidase N-terminal domain-containing protein [Mycolicibacterium fortuitum]
MKKLLISISTVMIFFLANVIPTQASGNEVIEHGILKNNRVLIPIRAVSQNMGIDVKWNQFQKTAQLTIGETVITLAVQFKRALVNQDRVDFDAPVELIHNTTYVPLRFVSQTMGADVKWDQKTKEATVILDGKQVVVKLMKPKYQVPTNQRLSDTRIARLSEKLNEASDLSKVKQVRPYFKPYFTDRLIQQIIEQEGLHFKEMNFDMNTATVNYASNTSAMLIQSYIPGNILTGELHYVFDREAHIIYANGAWKVDKVSDHLRQIPNMSLEPDLQ